MKLAVLLPNWVGDVVMATPTLRALRRRLPQAEIVAIMRPYLLPLLDGNPWMIRPVGWEHLGRGRTRRTISFVRHLRRERFDVLISLRNSGFDAAISRMGGIEQVYGYSRRASSLFLTSRLTPPRSGGQYTPVSAVDYYLRLARAFGCEEETRQLELGTTAAEEAAADTLWRELHLPAPQDVVVLNVGGAFGVAKHWPLEYGAELSRMLGNRLGVTVVIHCGPAERAAAAALVGMANHPRVLSLANADVGLGPAKVLIRRARLLVSTDSGPRHIAAAFGTPTVNLFGPIDPRWGQSDQHDAVELRVDLACSPCGKTRCPLGHHRCMRDLTPEIVFSAVERRLQPDGHGAST